MTKLKNGLQGFTIAPKSLIENNDLDPMSRFLYILMASKPDGWDFYEANLMASMRLKDPRTFRKYRNELVDAGWLLCDGQSINEKGQFSANEYEILPVPTVVQKMHDGPMCKKCRTAKNAPLNNKQPIEVKNNPHSQERVREEKLLSEAWENESWRKSVCKNHSLEPERLLHHWQAFISDSKANGDEHKDVKDVKKHFNHWIKTNKQTNTVEAAQQQRKNTVSEKRAEQWAAFLRVYDKMPILAEVKFGGYSPASQKVTLLCTSEEQNAELRCQLSNLSHEEMVNVKNALSAILGKRVQYIYTEIHAERS